MASSSSSAIENNNKLFSLFGRKLAQNDPEVYTTFTDKLGVWLSSERAYYPAARPEIVKLLLIAYRTLRRAVGADLNNSHFHISAWPDHPMAAPYIRLLQVVNPYISCFVEADLQGHVRDLLKTIEKPSASSTTHPNSLLSTNLHPTLHPDHGQSIDVQSPLASTLVQPQSSSLYLNFPASKSRLEVPMSNQKSASASEQIHAQPSYSIFPPQYSHSVLIPHQPDLPSPSTDTLNQMPQSSPINLAQAESNSTGFTDVPITSANPPDDSLPSTKVKKKKKKNKLELPTIILAKDFEELSRKRAIKIKQESIEGTGGLEEKATSVNISETPAVLDGAIHGVSDSALSGENPAGIEILPVEDSFVKSQGNPAHQSSLISSTGVPRPLTGPEEVLCRPVSPVTNPINTEAPFLADSLIQIGATEEPSMVSPSIESRTNAELSNISTLHSELDGVKSHINITETACYTADIIDMQVDFPEGQPAQTEGFAPSTPTKRGTCQESTDGVGNSRNYDMIDDKKSQNCEPIPDTAEPTAVQDLSAVQNELALALPLTPEATLQLSEPIARDSVARDQTLILVTNNTGNRPISMTDSLDSSKPSSSNSQSPGTGRKGTDLQISHNNHQLSRSSSRAPVGLNPSLQEDVTKPNQITIVVPHDTVQEDSGGRRDGEHIARPPTSNNVLELGPKDVPASIQKQQNELDAFGGEMRILAIHRGLSDKSKVTIRFEIPKEQYSAVMIWNKREMTANLEGSLCISLACYFLETSVSEAEAIKHISTHPPSWPQTGGLFMNVPYNGKQESISLSPPFSVTSGGLVDVSEFLCLGTNTMELNQYLDMSRYTFVLRAHHPTHEQLEEAAQRLKKNQDWHHWLCHISRPFNILIPAFS